MFNTMKTPITVLRKLFELNFFDVEYIYGFVRWGGGGLQTKSMTSQRAAYKMADMRYYGNVMTTTRWLLYVILHLQQYSHRLNLFFWIISPEQYSVSGTDH